MLARVLHLQGTLASQRGDAATARERYAASLALRERAGDRPAVGALLSNLALVAENEGEYDEAERLGRQALAVRTEVRDLWGVAVSENNLGMLALLRQDPGRPGPGSRRRCGSPARSATPGWSASGSTTWATPRGCWGTCPRPAGTWPPPWAPTSTATTAGRSRWRSRTWRCSAPRPAATTTPSCSPARPRPCATSWARPGRLRSRGSRRRPGRSPGGARRPRRAEGRGRRLGRHAVPLAQALCAQPAGVDRASG